MATMDHTDVATSSDSSAPPTRSNWGLIQLSLFWIANNFHWAAIPIIILPSQIRVLLYLNHPAGLSGADLATYIKNAAPGALALVVGPGLLVALVCNPLFGYFSDRTRLAWGRRLPYIFWGTLANVVGIGVMALAPNIPVLIAGLMLVQVANNAAAAPFHALLPDLVPESQRGKASGYMGLGQMIGSIFGATMPGIVFGVNAQQFLDGKETLGQYQHTMYIAYGFTALVQLVLALATVWTVHERPLPQRSVSLVTTQSEANSHMARNLAFTVGVMVASVFATVGVLQFLRIDLGNELSQNVLIFPALIIGTLGVARVFDLRPRQNGDFFWVLITRAIMMMGIYTIESFLQFYLKYVTFQNVANAPKPEDAAGIFIDIVIVMAVVSTGFAGVFSDRFGRKRMVYLSGIFMALVGVLFLATPLLMPSVAVISTFIFAAIFGLGYGAYVSVDWALVTDVLPNEDNYARDMGIWNVALTTPQVLSYVLGAFTIAAFNTGGILAIAGQPNLGYLMLFVMLVIYAVLGTITVRFIRGVKR
jgi:MFS family permease